MNFKSTISACYIGNFVAATITNLTPILFIPLMKLYNLSYAQLGFLIFINFITQVTFDIAFSKAADKYGFRPFVVVAHGIAAVGLCMFAFVPIIFPGNIYLGFVISTVVFSGAGGLLELLLSPIIDAIPSEQSAKAMNFLHSFYAWGQVTVIIVTTFLLWLLGINKWWVIVLIWAIIPLLNTYLFSKVTLIQKHEHYEHIMKIKQLFKSPVFIICLFAILFGAASEVTMNQWASAFVEKALLLPKFAGDMTGMCVFAITLGLGRVLNGVYGAKFNISKVLIWGCVGAFICYVMVAVSPWSILSVIACGVCGIFVSLMWPGTLIVASDKLPMAGASMFALLAASGDIGASIGPWFTGIVVQFSQNTNLILKISRLSGLTLDQLGLRAGILGAAVFPLIALICHRALMNKHSD